MLDWEFESLRARHKLFYRLPHNLEDDSNQTRKALCRRGRFALQTVADQRGLSLIIAGWFSRGCPFNCLSL
jgi:hypothetical protein